MRDDPGPNLSAITPAGLAAFQKSISLAIQENAPTDYCESALDKLRAHISFARAVWGMATHAGDTDMFYGLGIDAVSADAEYQVVAANDPLLPKLMNNPNTPVRMNIEDVDPSSSQPLIDWLNRWGLQRTLSIGFATAVTETQQIVSIYRGTEQAPFNESEQQLFSQLAPTMVEGLRRCRENNLKEHLFEAWSSTHFVATATHAGAVFDMEPRFLEGLQSAWPDWQGPILPAEIVRLLQDGQLTEPGLLLKKGSVVIRALPSVSSHVLIMTYLEGLADLTPRQFQIARLYAQGFSTKEIARQLELKLVTIQNHRKHIYATLGIGSNNELTHQFRHLDEHSDVNS